ncbi:CDP-diacylglycerol--serine O-phosphatidyltransferase [Candidatus Woesearchaeota archaeon]|nr:CDP-diacylglycerol--serine O-phosphatidyltransferase [Candidatus Woesearchaeota archaeon]
MSKNVFSMMKFADFFTLANALFGTLSIYASMLQRFNFAAGFMLISVVFDFLDGQIAKKTRTTLFGKELDSLADMISFGAAPIVFGFSQIQTELGMAAFSVFILCGILRLARYNSVNNKDFVGMPITTNGFIIPIIYFANLQVMYYPYIFFVLAILMVLPVKVKRFF